ncbi:hypothetical protein [Streptomyces sp. cmx-4-9]|uniref:hypothetical protein n=1 Tax=Streptomyces sp. cmx-4-9 TaxID=2790941 RepID=UPI00398013E1
MGQKTTQDAEPGKPEPRKLDLSAAQVAGSSLATVAAALLASQLGVYGTILGAGVVSVVATAGGPVIGHVFRRTGDQLRESTRPRTRRAPAGAEPRTSGDEPGPPGEAPGPPADRFGDATVHGTRVRGRRRTAVAAGVAFALSMGVLGTYEAVAGTSVSSGGGTIFSGGTRTVQRQDPAPAPERPGADRKDGKDGKDGKAEEDGKGSGSGTATPPPSGSPGTGGARSPGPSTTPSDVPSTGPAPSTSAPASPPAPPASPSPHAAPSTAGTGGGAGSGGGAGMTRGTDGGR